MTEDGPLWYEQADTLARYVIENQSVEGLSDSEGYATDAVSSVSINISGFINALKTCLFNLSCQAVPYVCPLTVSQGSACRKPVLLF